MKKYLLFLLGCAFTFLSCKKEYTEVSDAKVRLGLSQTAGIITFEDTFRLQVLTNKPFAEAREIDFSVSTELIEGVDYQWIDNRFQFDADELEDEIALVILRRDTALLGKEFRFELTQDEGYNLEEIRAKGFFEIGVGHTVDIGIWAPDEAFPQLWGYDNDPNQNTGTGNGRHFAFAYPSLTKQNVIGIYNLDSTRSTNAFNMHRIYAEQDVSSASARIRIFEALKFVPYEEGANEGQVFFIPQRVKIYRKSSSTLPPFFYIGMEGEGTYSEQTELIEITLIFDESEIGGPTEVVRKFLLSANEL